MSSRDAVLKAIRRNKPAPVPLPEIPSFGTTPDDLVSRFKTLVQEIGGEVREVGATDTIASVVDARYPDLRTRCSALSDHVAGTLRLDEIDDPHDLAGVDLFICAGMLGVAENGAIWVTESDMGHRAAPFITQHLALVLDPRHVVATMHDAYARLRVQETGYGVFIAGPSKTADIEQSLVIGAHGPRSLTVVLV